MGNLARSVTGNALLNPLGCFRAERFGGFENKASVSAIAKNSDDFLWFCFSLVVNNLATHQDSVEARLSLELSDNPVVVFRKNVNRYFH
jgi:hypothetical protein